MQCSCLYIYLFLDLEIKNVFCILLFTGSNEKYKGSVLTLFKSPLVVITWLNLVLSSLSIGYFEPTLAGHLIQVSCSGSVTITCVIGLVQTRRNSYVM